MTRAITRIVLVVTLVSGVVALSAISVAADRDIPTTPIPPIEQPGPRVAFRMTRLPRLVYVDGEEFGLSFTAAPLTDAVLIWNLDISSAMTYGSRFEPGRGLEPTQNALLSEILLRHGISPNPIDPRQTLQDVWRQLDEAKRSELVRDLAPFGFRYEPWASALDMLRSFWIESGLCDGVLGLVSGPGGSILIHHPCLSPQRSMEVLIEHGPAGWYEFAWGVTETLQIATRYASHGYPVDVFIVNRGPVWEEERDQIPDMIDRANAAGIPVHVVPMGNEPGRRERFPYLKPLRELAEGTGGLIYYEPNRQNPYDFSMLPRMVPRMMQDYYARIGQMERGTQVASRASLVLSPSDHVQILAPAMTDVATHTSRVRIDFHNLRIGEPQSVDIQLRVSTNVTQTLLPVFRGSTEWTDPEYSYFEWVDRGGLLHRVPLPQRVISVTTNLALVDPPNPEPSPTPRATQGPAHPPTPTLAPLPIPTDTPTTAPTATPAAVPTRRPTATSAPTSTVRPPASSTPTSTVTASSTPTLAASPVTSSTPTLTATASSTPTLTATPTASSTPTLTASPTAMSTATPTTAPTSTSTSTPTALPVSRQPPTPTATHAERSYKHRSYIPFVNRHRIVGQAYRPYPGPRAVVRVEVPLLDAVLQRLSPLLVSDKGR